MWYHNGVWAIISRVLKCEGRVDTIVYKRSVLIIFQKKNLYEGLRVDSKKKIE